MTHPEQPYEGSEQAPPSGGQEPYGQPTGGAPQQPPYGQGQYGQPPYGQVPYGQGPYGQPQGPQYYGAPVESLDPAQERLFAGGAHWGALLAGVFTSGGLAWAAPLAILMLKGKSSPFVRSQALESLNFQISTLIYAAVVLVMGIATLGVGLLLFLPLAVWWLVLVITAAVKANNGEDYRYPLIFRFVK
ncbi:DUF4870 domain-containing protein [Nocardioides jishulii]|uniref:DUF4870 domain-containing protein n=1 Tax=Nocardioides jishulii TaxID=2575440 RepID=A0A4U2YHW8_9ACTN|nr:DUF4870 domain-containing protein [Nocardioides jishulii]QCX27984.1 DUF4870 domain-containing protein [Nocardioides jishulii]TKI60648.1 DUF4870 domain-containing protein [Nocardioides jishulii]